MQFQAPKGTRDFYPQDMATRNYLVDAWRRVSIRNGFEQVDGPIFESLDLYKVKSGEGIVSELFHFTDRADRGLAIRPEFTPTLARMVAEKANALPKPIKWFCTPNLCRAEAPQRGRLREFWQWNADILGSDLPIADAECIFTCVDLLAELKLTARDVRVKISHRQTARHVLTGLGVTEDNLIAAFDLLDRRAKISDAEFKIAAAALGLSEASMTKLDEICKAKYPCGQLAQLSDALGGAVNLADLDSLDRELKNFGIAEWCEYDLGIVRGLAYYTGTVFEVHESSGAERAMAGGGRYDQLIELFGGPKTPGIGFGMGDVVLANVLTDKGLMPADVMPRPDVFVIAANDAAGAKLGYVVGKLRMAGLHARMTYKTTRNVGKLLKDATGSRARFAIILDDNFINQETCSLKNLDGSQQQEGLSLDAVIAAVRG